MITVTCIVWQGDKVLATVLQPEDEASEKWAAAFASNVAKQLGYDPDAPGEAIYYTFGPSMGFL